MSFATKTVGVAILAASVFAGVASSANAVESGAVHSQDFIYPPGNETEFPIPTPGLLGFGDGRVDPWGRIASIPVEFWCDAGQSYSITLKLAQADVSGTGTAHGECAGTTFQQEIVAVPADGHSIPEIMFHPGGARGTVIFDSGASHETLTKNIQLARWDNVSN